ncbi:hypothetical protein F4X10_12020 [Candidatus Poribacteria bacterium]|nr:hypothetical protein [Candidatus Poribacteria bacterium]
MKTLMIGFLILAMMSGPLNAAENDTPNKKITLNLDSRSEVSVKGFIAPITDTMSNFHVTWEALANLRAAEPEKQHPASVFRAFLPDKAVLVGELWEIEETGVLELLRQLHPNPNLKMHINAGDSYGLWACLRAYNDTFADIVFRIHAEFKLENGWFTPSQFTGHLVIDRIQERVAFFEMSVPEGVVNFDVNRRHKNARSFGTDMGFCPQVELHAGTPGVLRDTQFAETITQEAAERALALRFYRSQQINWVSLEEALNMVQAQQKPIHAISIDGPLADEAC